MKKVISLSFAILGFLSFFPIQGQVNLENGLIAFYPFNNNADDESGNQYHSDLNETATIDFDCEGNENSAYTFDGVDDYIQVPNTDALNFSSNQIFSIAFWVKMPIEQNNINGAVNDLISKWSVQVQNGYPYAIRTFNQTDDRNGKIWIGQYDTNNCNVYPQVISNSRINDNKWHHVVITRELDNILKLFIDDVLQGENDAVVTCDISNDSDILFGLRKKTGFETRAFTGSLDNIRFYDRALSLEEINALFNKNQNISNINNLKKEDHTLIYPNPVFNGILKIKTSDSTPIVKIKIYDASGKFIFETKNVNEINVGSLKSGLFILKIDFKNKESIMRKIIVQNEFRV